MDRGNAVPTRKVGILLGIGIFLLPIIFAWFTLRAGHSTRSRVISFVWMAVVLVFYAVGAGSDPAGTGTTNATAKTDADVAAISAPDTKAAGTPSAPRTKWRYSESHDEMRDDTSKFATIRSENELDFEFPYNGGSGAEITVRRNKRDGLDVYIRIDKGQFLCNSFSGTSIAAKFDDGPIQQFTCTDSSSGESEYAFIPNAQRFLTALKGSERVMIEAEFYQYGRGQYTFDTAGLEFD
jgi:hypothetical protein